MWCSARSADLGRDRSRGHCRRHRRLRDPRGGCGDFSGLSVSSAGDINGDGFDDLIIGAYFADGPGAAPGTRNEAGDSYVVFGQAGGFGTAIDLHNVAAGIGGFVIHGADASDFSGSSVSSAGDIDGDGFDDLILGAFGGDGPGTAPGTRSHAGDSYVLFGSATIGGSANHVTNVGGDGMQTLTGSAADDDMVAGRDNDILLGNGGADVLIGGHGNDVLSIADATFRRINGGTGNDVLAFAGGITLVDTDFRKIYEVEGLRLGNGSTSLTLGPIAARAIDGLGNSVIAIDGTQVTAGSVTIDATALVRPLSLTMGTANDSITLLGGNVTVDGGGGIDTIATALSYTLGANTENLTLIGSAPNGTGNALNNTITGNAAANVLDGGIGNDFLDGGLGNDTMIGGAGNDTFVINSAGDLLFDSGGVDLVRSTVSKTLGAGFENLTLLGTAPINGAGNAAANTILGNAGGNRLFGLGGNDTINVGAGHDTLDGGLGNDRMIGGAGNDTFVVNAAGDVLSDAAGIDLVKSTVSRTLAAGFEKLTLLGAAAINGTGNAATNLITGNGGNNKLSGLGGNDTINGGLGKDILTGGLGRDILFGDFGIDILTGGLGKDTMTGGAGADDFDFNSVAEIGKGATRDVIKDFAHLVDDIDLSTIDANGAAPGHAFTFLATKGAAFTGTAGELRWFQQNLAGAANDRTIIEGDTNGNRVADFQIQLIGIKSLTLGDFIL